MFQMHDPQKDNFTIPLYKRRSIPRPHSNGTDSQLNDTLNPTVTVVTAYFDIGSFQKGFKKSHVVTPDLYKKWFKIFSRIKNPVIAYFDTEETKRYFDEYVRRSNGTYKTKSVMVDRDELWSFGLFRRTKKIVSNPFYPKHHPNTEVAEYSIAMHAKYELMHKSVISNPFRTGYFCWLDVGYFRDIAEQENQPHFSLRLPPSFDINSVAYTKIYSPDKFKTAREIFYDNVLWVGGGFFIGEQTVMLNWAEEYMKYTDYFLKRGYVNTDQQVIYAMFNTQKPETKIQTYICDEGVKKWFCLGYTCMNFEAETK